MKTVISGTLCVMIFIVGLSWKLNDISTRLDALQEQVDVLQQIIVDVKKREPKSIHSHPDPDTNRLEFIDPDALPAEFDFPVDTFKLKTPPPPLPPWDSGDIDWDSIKDASLGRWYDTIPLELMESGLTLYYDSTTQSWKIVDTLSHNHGGGE